MSTATTTPDTVDPIDSLNDFTDKLSPIVVKELRQGLRQPSFVILFLFLQSVLALAVITALLAVSPTRLSERLELGTTITAFFFGLFGLAVIVIQPMRALATLSSEIRDSTIDLLLLTRLNAWRIVFGKWLSLVTQSALLLVAIMPYLMMRYFLGGMNLLAELGLLACLFLLGSMMCAGGVAMSSVRSVILRVIFAILGIIGFIFLFWAFGAIFTLGPRIFPGSGGSLMGALDWIWIISGAVLLVGFMTYAFLEFAATRIAPPSENRSKRKRLISIGALILIPFLFTLADLKDPFICYISIMLIAPIAMADAFSENPRYVSPQKKDLILLRPGWPSGAIFGLLMLTLAFAWSMVLSSSYSTGILSNINGHLRFSQAVGTILLIVSQPAVIIAFFRPRSSEPASLYLACLFGSLTLGMVLLMISVAVNEDEMIAQVLFPLFPVLGFVTLGDPSSFKSVGLFLAAAFYLLCATTIGHRHWKQTE